MNALAMGAGASEGLDRYLERMLEEAKLKQMGDLTRSSQAETSRHNMADEANTAEYHKGLIAERNAQESVRAQTAGRALGDEIPPNTFMAENDPAAMSMQKAGLQSLLKPQEDRPAVDVGPLQPGDTGEARLKGFVKQPSFNQVDKLADNARADKTAAKGRPLPASTSDSLAGLNVAEVEGVKVLRSLHDNGLHESNDPLDPRWQKFMVTTLKMAPQDWNKADIQQRTAAINAMLTRGLMGARPSQYVAQIIQQHLPQGDMTGQQLFHVINNVLEQAGERRTEIESLSGQEPGTYAPKSGGTYRQWLDEGGGGSSSGGASGGGGDAYSEYLKRGQNRTEPSASPQQTAPTPSQRGSAPVLQMRSTPLDTNRLPESGETPAGGRGMQVPSEERQAPLDSSRVSATGRLQSQAPRRMGNKVSEQGMSDLQTREGGFYAEPYNDVSGMAVGYGQHTFKGKPVTAETRATKPEADQDMSDQIKAKYGKYVDDHLTVPVSQAQYDALVSVAWNLPSAAGRIIAKLNAGQPVSKADFQVSATVKGKPHKGLGLRRTSEFDSFSSPD